MELLAKKFKQVVQEGESVQDRNDAYYQEQDTVVLPSDYVESRFEEFVANNEESLTSSFPALELLASLRAKMPNEVQSVIAQLLYECSNVEAFLQSNIGAVRCNTFASEGETSLFNRELDKLLVVCENSVRLLAVENGECLQTFEKLDHIHCYLAAYSKDNTMILLGGMARVHGQLMCRVRLFSATSGKCLQTFDHRGFCTLSINPTFRFNAAEDRVLIAFGTLITLWSVESGQCLHEFRNEAEVYSAFFNGAEDKIVTFSKSRNGEDLFRIWSIETGMLVPNSIPVDGHVRRVRTVRTVNGTDMICMTAGDGTIKVLSVITGESLQTFRGHEKQVLTILFNRSGDTLLTSSLDSTAKVWSVESGECLQTFNHEEACRGVFNTIEDKILTYSVHKYTLNGLVKVWSVESGECLLVFNFQECIAHVAFKGANFVRILYHGGTVRIVDISFWERLKRSLTLSQSYLLGKIRQLAKHMLWLKLKEKEGVAVLTQDGKKVTEDQLVIDFNVTENEGLQDAYEALPQEIKDDCDEYIQGCHVLRE